MSVDDRDGGIDWNSGAFRVVREWFAVAGEDEQDRLPGWLSSDKVAEIARAFEFDTDPKSQTIMRLVAHVRAVGAPGSPPGMTATTDDELERCQWACSVCRLPVPDSALVYVGGDTYHRTEDDLHMVRRWAGVLAAHEETP